MSIELKVPAVGESITEVQIGQWLKSEGESAERDQPLVEIESDKATVELVAPQAGRLAKVLKQTGETATVGEVIGFLDEKADKTGPAKAELPKAESPKAESPKAGAPKAESTPFVMPAAARAAAEHEVAASEVSPTGPGGRVLKEDVERHVARETDRRTEGTSAPPAAPSRAAPSPGASADEVDAQIVPMSPLRRRVAERLVEAQQTAALLTTFNEIDLSAVVELRTRHRESFQQKHSVKLGFMSFFVKAVIDGLKQVPQLNAEIRGADVVYYSRFDIGVAVGGGKGLVVPVLRGADLMSFADVERAIADFGQRAKENKIKLEELRGGTFTISNGGIFGSLLSTPIVNPPQSGILGMHAIQDRPVAREGQVVIRPMMYVALTYDHRLVDGREAVLFLRHVKEILEEPARMLLEL
jgi:2-oxoglutarate dehydrogenase E2 component (dihydrolipoamide succinyltransferase)